MDKQLTDYIELHQSNKEKSCDFVTYLYELFDKHHVDKASDLYNKANISRQVYSKIISNQVVPSLNTCIKLVFALEATNHECKTLLKKAGYTLSSSSLFALIIRYHLENGIYDLYLVNKALEEANLEPII